MRPGDVGATLQRVVLRQRHMHERAARAGQLKHHPRQLEHGELARIAEVHRGEDRMLPLRRLHQHLQRVDHIRDIAERPRLQAVAIDRQRLATDRLHDEVRHHAPVLRVHPRTVGIENPGDADVHPLRAMGFVEQRLGSTLALVIAGARANGVDVAAVALGLRAAVGIAIDLRAIAYGSRE
ncbi:hypothetical protein SDC9_47043 [bioreactor metagenome]|uniref:Uncharacterized protein n=1 Tax=bioreactor metagenome TaxID=1076179 RepID=A0A644WBF0_9ZZZZ